MAEGGIPLLLFGEMKRVFTWEGRSDDGAAVTLLHSFLGRVWRALAGGFWMTTMVCRTKLMKAIPSPILFVTKIPSGDNHDLVGVQKDISSVGERRVCWLLIYYTQSSGLLHERISMWKGE